MTLSELINPMNLVFENTSDRNRYLTLLKEESQKPTQKTMDLIDRLYESLLKKSHYNYDNIPQSKGVITKYEGYANMVETLKVIDELSIEQTKKSLPEVQIIQSAIENIERMKDVFSKGFTINNDFIILQYNTLVAACVTSTNAVLVGYLDYGRSVDQLEFKPSGSVKDGNLLLSNLNLFNRSVNSGQYENCINTILNTAVKKVAEESFWLIPVAVVGATILIVSILRALVFYFFYARTLLSEELSLQATFLELNAANVNSKNIPTSDKKRIVNNQAALSKKLRMLADKIRVNDDKANDIAVKQLKKDDSNWMLDDVQSDSQSAYTLV